MGLEGKVSPSLQIHLVILHVSLWFEISPHMGQAYFEMALTKGVAVLHDEGVFFPPLRSLTSDFLGLD